jgi:DNA polymerase III subunit epsilon
MVNRTLTPTPQHSLMSGLTIVDVETTGGSPFFNRVIEVGVLRVAHGEVVETFETILNPGTPIPEFITKMTGIGDDDVRSAPVFDDIKDKLIELCEGSIFVAHNVNFDFAFLAEEFRRVGYGFTADKLCTVRLSRALYPEHKRHNLSEIISRFNFECARRHRALDDAKVLWDFLQVVSSSFPKEDINFALRRILQTLPTPVQSAREVVDETVVLYDPDVQS